MSRDIDKLYEAYAADSDDQAKLGALLEAVTGHARKLANRHGHNDPEDVGQETMIRCWKDLSTYDPTKGSLKSWVSTVALNYMRKQADLLRNRMTEYPEHLPEPECSDVEVKSYSLEWANDEEKQLLFHLSQTLDFAETARHFLMSPKALRSRLERIKAKRNLPAKATSAITSLPV
jgi:RNA polymerase sigma factor (sigma-70 family)